MVALVVNGDSIITEEEGEWKFITRAVVISPNWSGIDLFIHDVSFILGCPCRSSVILYVELSY